MISFIENDELGLTADEIISYITRAFAIEADAYRQANALYEKDSAEWEAHYDRRVGDLMDAYADKREPVDIDIVLDILEPLGLGEAPAHGWTYGFGLELETIEDLSRPENWRETAPIDYALADGD